MEYREIRLTNWRARVGAALEDGGRLSALFANDERSIGGDLAIYAIIGYKERGEFLGFKTHVSVEEPIIGSLVPVCSAAAWYEREMHDLFGIIPEGHPDLRPMVLHENWPAGVYPLRKDFDAHTEVPLVRGDYEMPQVKGEGIFEVPVGPIHAGIIEPGHFRFSQLGEHIIRLEAKLFFTHRGIEKTVEGLTAQRAFYQVERICGACAVSHALSYSQALESMVQVTLPPAARYARVVVAELERLYNHVGDIGNVCAGLGFAIGINHGARLKEMLMRLNERLIGNRFLRGWVVPGGISKAIDSDMAEDIFLVLREVEVELADIITILRDSEAFLDRVDTTGIVHKQAALDLAIVGVGARASGVDIDLRRDIPYAEYDELKPRVILQDSGDVAARIWVRAEEAVQSFNLVRQALRKLEELENIDYRVELPQLPEYATALGWSESARGSNLHWVMTGKNGTIYRLFVRSASYPNWPALAVAAPGNIIPDFPLINKSFELCYACIDR